MNTGRLIWGIICLAIAALLAVLNFTLPPENLMFMIGDTNMPWVPVTVLGIVGVVLVISAAQGSSEEDKIKELKEKEPDFIIDEEAAARNKQLEAAAWGLFLIMLGGFALIPDAYIPKGAWSIGVGLIMLGLNAARYFSGIRMSGFTTVLGILAVGGGIAELLGFTSLEGGMLLIILGAYLILKPWFEKQQLFGKAEHA
jgi:hypothetical protein